MNNSIDLNFRNPVEVREKGLKALNDVLGTAGTVCFLRQFSEGRGNWTEERKEILANYTEADFDEELQTLRENRLL